MTGHGYNVNPVMEQDPANPPASNVHYRAVCECGADFPRRREQYDAALDGLDHVRTARGAQTRRDEIDSENRARAADK